MKRFKIKGTITTKETYPYWFEFELVKDANSKEEAKDMVWNSFQDPVSMSCKCEEFLG